MRGKVNDRNIYVMWAGALLLGVAYGVALSLTPLHLKDLEFTERQIGTLARKVAAKVATDSTHVARIDGGDVEGYLGPPRFRSEAAFRTSRPMRRACSP